MDMSQEPFCMEISKRNARPQAHKSQFVWKLTGKVPDPDPGAHILCGNLEETTHMDMSQEPFFVYIYRKSGAHSCRGPGEHLDWTPGFNTHRKNPFSVATLFGDNI